MYVRVMGKYLVVVESPTKAHTISTILGKDFDVLSSKGHVMDLPSNRLSIKVDKGFEPSYRIIPGKEKIVKLLRQKAKNKEAVYLATDPDREGEAIGWHIKELLSQDASRFYRVVFHEITEEAVKEAFASAGDIDMNKVNAQKTRRVLDRIVGYYLSPLLWKKVLRGLSAGRVQSVALKFIVDREKEIRAFVPKTTYEIEGIFKKGEVSFKAKLKKAGGKDAVFLSREDATGIIEGWEKETFYVKGIVRKKLLRKPQPPFTTSLLQQEAFNKLRFSSKKTMLIAQRLYEGISVGYEVCGLITYMRTDSFRVADKAKQSVKEFIEKEFGRDYVVSQDYKFKEKKGVQGAHEAIRPTSVFRTPESVKQYLKPDEYKLYDLIWRRFVASFMKEAVFETTRVEIAGGDMVFGAEGKKLVFDGFLKVIGEKGDGNLLPSLEKGEKISLNNVEVVEKTTKPPPRFTDASLVKLLEEKGIGRPSTYAPTISTLIMRNYVRREKGHFVPTDLGIKVAELLVEHFPDIIDEKFTAEIESKLDGVEEGRVEGRKILEEFFPPFREKVEEATKVIKKHNEFVDKKCPLCGRPLMIKWSKRGRFLSCSAYPECKYAESITTGVKCPSCGKGELVERRNKRGQLFYGCTEFPECRYTSRELPQSEGKSNNGK